MKHFNAVLLPPADFSDRVVEYAQDHYSDISDGYCLSHKVYPHITLCQFQAEEPPMIFVEEVFNPVFLDANIRNGTGIHGGFNWIEWTVKKDDWLVQLQNTIIGELEGEGIKANTKSGLHYHPHMTFCRVAEEKSHDIPLAQVEQTRVPWIFTIGSSDENGQFLG